MRNLITVITLGIEFIAIAAAVALIVSLIWPLWLLAQAL